MTFLTPLLLPLSMMVLAQVQADDESQTANPEEAASQTPIIVEGSTSDPEIRAQTGSRIPGEPLYRDINVATSTGIAGLTPGSGISPFHGANPVHKRITSTCVSDNDAVGERASCLLIQGRDAVAEDDIVAATDIYRFLASNDEFGPEERLAGGTELYNLAGAIGDAALREEALIRLMESGALEEAQERGAMRTLIDMAIARNANALAIARLQEFVSTGEVRPEDFANLAILTRDAGQSGAKDAMQRAIDLQRDLDQPVDQGWLDFVRDTSNIGSEPALDEPAEFATTDVILNTDMGPITIALEMERAPITAGNFLRYVEEGRFDGIVFYRAMHVEWGDGPNGLIQGGAQWDPDRILPGIPHEPTTITGLSHTRGALSMAMGEPGTANGDFSIMVGDQTGLDAKPESDDPVWQNGYAVFGYVTDGMDVVMAIHAAPLDPDAGEGWMKGQMLAQPVTVIDARVADTDPPTAQ
ncbi:MAG: peptidylprolyl isomerase [Erythrobacter sp.]